MTRYFTCFRQKQASRPNGPCEINLHDPRTKRTRNITVRGLTREIEGIDRIVGIEYCSSLEADSVRSAEEISKNDFDFVASLISFMTGVSISAVRPIVIFSNDKDSNTHEFLQYEYLRTPYFGVLGFDPVAVYHAISGFNMINNSNITERIASSLKFYRKAQATIDPVERFMLLWISIEYLDYALVKRMNKKPVGICSKCGVPLKCSNCHKKASPSITAGLEDFAGRTGNGVLTNLKGAIGLRGRIFHRETDLGKASREAATHNLFLRGFYISIMRHLMSLDPGLNIMPKFVHTVESIMVIEAKVELPEPGELRIENGKIPHYVIEEQPGKIETKENGLMSQSMMGKYDQVDFPEGAVFKDERFTPMTIGVKTRDFRVWNDSQP